MKLICLALLLAVAFSAATNTKFQECIGKIKTTCNADCQKKFADKCGDGTDVDKSDQCKYIDDNPVTKADEDWSEEYGANFHGCADQCLGELDGDAKTYYEELKACSANVLAVAALALVALLF